MAGGGEGGRVSDELQPVFCVNSKASDIYDWRPLMKWSLSSSVLFQRKSQFYLNEVSGIRDFFLEQGPLPIHVEVESGGIA